MNGISILMAFCDKERPEWLRECLGSIRDQTRPPNEIILVQDGPVSPELRDLVVEFTTFMPIVLIMQTEQGGLGPALAVGLGHCRYSYVARMDADDVCYVNRLEIQESFLNLHSNVAVVGAFCAEFDEMGRHGAVALRKVPSHHVDIVHFARYRNPMNHMTVMFRRQSILSIGGYQNLHGFEDYDLWVRGIIAGLVFANVAEPLVWARTGAAFVDRRGGIEYVKAELRALKRFRQYGFLKWRHFAIGAIMRTVARLGPRRFRQGAYSLLRK
jgi:glycosyltransferase involved in cell wall biosynthesis